MQRVPITLRGPYLEGVLGPMGPELEQAARAGIVDAGGGLAGIAERLGRYASGMELDWYPSGQMFVRGAVQTGDGPSRAVTFLAELQPSWALGTRTGQPGWLIEASVEVDCQHSPDHGSMHTVFESNASASMVEEAVAALAEAVHQLDRLANEPIATWADRGGD